MPFSQAISSQTLRRHRLTVDDYYKMGAAGIFTEKDRVELIDGEIIDMAPIGAQHAYLLNRLNRIFSKQISDTALIRIQDPIHLNHHNEPEPDLVLVANKNYSTHHPGPKETLLVIEIADSSLAYDLEIKTPLYAKHNIPEVWIIDLGSKFIHTYQQPKDGTYQQHNSCDKGHLSPSLVSDLVLNIDDLWSD